MLRLTHGKAAIKDSLIADLFSCKLFLRSNLGLSAAPFWQAFFDARALTARVLGFLLTAFTVEAYAVFSLDSVLPKKLVYASRIYDGKSLNGDFQKPLCSIVSISLRKSKNGSWPSAAL